MKKDYDELINAGVKAQLERLEQNEHKEGFDNIELKYAYKRIKQETRELWKELYFKPFLLMISAIFPRCYTDYRSVRGEFADIANFAHMGIYKCDEEIE